MDYSSDLYLRVREKEGRIYPDDVVSRLPVFMSEQRLAVEWRIRANSTARLSRYLAKRKRPMSILELGCGNGWLSNRLSQIPAVKVWGLDRFSSELVQARRVFRQLNLEFLTADIYNSPFSADTFDVVVLASVIQYFPDPVRLIKTLHLLIHKNSEIHILDSPIYRPQDINLARERTKAYYTSLGFPEMAEYYYHHSATVFNEFNTSWLYHPDRIQNRLIRLLGKDVNPFPWIVIH